MNTKLISVIEAKLTDNKFVLREWVYLLLDLFSKIKSIFGLGLPNPKTVLNLTEQTETSLVSILIQ